MPDVAGSIARLQRALTREAKLAQRDLEAALEALAAEHARRLTGPSRSDVALNAAARSIARLSAAADLGGRLELRFGSPAAEPEEFAASVPDVVPVVAFDEAVRDLSERDPIGAAELRRAGLEVEDAYGAVETADGPFYAHGFALARAADAEVAKRVRDRLVAGLSAGETTEEVAQDIAKTWDWPTSYARNVARTTYGTATSAGRFREAKRLEGIVPVAFRFATAGDSNVRPGHAALDGIVARSDDPFWRSWTPPLGWQCRCVAVVVIGDEVPDSFVTVPAGASKDPGFGTRGDLRAYG